MNKHKLHALYKSKHKHIGVFCDGLTRTVFQNDPKGTETHKCTNSHARNTCMHNLYTCTNTSKHISVVSARLTWGKLFQGIPEVTDTYTCTNRMQEAHTCTTCTCAQTHQNTSVSSVPDSQEEKFFKVSQEAAMLSTHCCEPVWKVLCKTSKKLPQGVRPWNCQMGADPARALQTHHNWSIAWGGRNAEGLEDLFEHRQTRASQHWLPEGKRSGERKWLTFYPLRLGIICLLPDQHCYGFAGNLSGKQLTDMVDGMHMDLPSTMTPSWAETENCKNSFTSVHRFSAQRLMCWSYGSKTVTSDAMWKRVLRQLQKHSAISWAKF